MKARKVIKTSKPKSRLNKKARTDIKHENQKGE